MLLAKPKASTGTRFCLLVLLLLLLQIEIAFAQARTRGNGKTCCALRRDLLQVVGGKKQRDKNVLVVVVANGLAGAVGAPRAFDGCCPSSCARADPRLLSPATDSSRHVRRLLPRRLGDCKCWEGERGIESDALTDTHAYVLCFVSAASSPHQPLLQSRATDSAALRLHPAAFYDDLCTAFDGCCPSSCASVDPRLLSPATDLAAFATTCAPCTTTAA